jgi:hypothetical protein
LVPVVVVTVEMVRWCGGQGVLEVRRWGSGGEVLVVFGSDVLRSDAVSVRLMSCVFCFFDIWISDHFQICWDLQNSFWVSEGFQICWDLQVSGIWLIFIASVLTVSFLSASTNFRLMELLFGFWWAE